MSRSPPGQKQPLLRARPFLSDRRCRSKSVSATRLVRHSVPLRLSIIARPHEVGLDSWRADSQSLSMARARNYPMCENAKTLNRDRRSYSSKPALVAQGASGLNLEVGLGKYHSSLRFDF